MSYLKHGSTYSCCVTNAVEGNLKYSFHFSNFFRVKAMEVRKWGAWEKLCKPIEKVVLGSKSLWKLINFSTCNLHGDCWQQKTYGHISLEPNIFESDTSLNSQMQVKLTDSWFWLLVVLFKIISWKWMIVGILILGIRQKSLTWLGLTKLKRLFTWIFS